MGPRAGLDTDARGKILCLCRGSKTGPPVCSQTELSQLLPIADAEHKIINAVNIAINRLQLKLHNYAKYNTQKDTSIPKIGALKY
jgi:hypothetical protein